MTPKTERALNALARRRRQTRSDVVREAIEQYASAPSDRDAQRQEPYHQGADVLGVVRMRRRSPEKTPGELFADFVGRKARARHSR